MIIKSMSRKEGSYGQLYDYMRFGASREDDKYRFIHNCYGRNRDDIVLDFEEHGARLKKRKNGVYLYHEIISITRSKTLSEQKQKEALYEIVREYIKKRAPKQLSCGYMHDEKDNNLHFHLMISSSEVSKAKRVRLEKRAFANAKAGLEEWVLAKYPELEQKKLISKESTYRTDKDQFVDSLQSIFATAKTRREFHALLKNHNAGYKIRGETVTFINEKTGKKHRAKTLGVMAEYEKMVAGFELVENKEKSKEGQTKKASKTDEKKNKADYGSAKEWVFGDFTKRDEKIKEAESKKKKTEFKRQDKEDSKVKNKDEQTFGEKAEEAFNEWIFGDFSARNARRRVDESKQRLKKWREKQKDKSHNKGHKK